MKQIYSVIALFILVLQIIFSMHYQAIGCISRLVDNQNANNAEFVQTIKVMVSEIDLLKKASKLADVQTVTVTAYTPSKDECDNDPDITASMKQIRPGTIAVSRDLFKAGWVFGKKVYIDGYGVFEILDLMHERWTKRIDIVMFSKAGARQFGKKDRIAALLQL